MVSKTKQKKKRKRKAPASKATGKKDRLEKGGFGNTPKSRLAKILKEFDDLLNKKDFIVHKKCWTV